MTVSLRFQYDNNNAFLRRVLMHQVDANVLRQKEMKTSASLVR